MGLNSPYYAIYHYLFSHSFSNSKLLQVKYVQESFQLFSVEVHTLNSYFSYALAESGFATENLCCVAVKLDTNEVDYWGGKSIHNNSVHVVATTSKKCLIYKIPEK